MSTPFAKLFRFYFAPFQVSQIFLHTTALTFPHSRPIRSPIMPATPDAPFDPAIGPELPPPDAADAPTPEADQQPKRKRAGNPNFGPGVGCPKGAEKSTKLTFLHDREAVIDATADALTSGRGFNLRASPQLGPVRETDKRAITRLTGWAPEQFNEKLGLELQSIVTKVVSRIEDKLDADEYKPNELTFLFAVIEDKRARLDGRAQLANGSVNVQINNFGPATLSRAEIMSSLRDRVAEKVEQQEALSV